MQVVLTKNEVPDDVIEVIGSGFRPVELTLFADFVKAGSIE